ncbi:hypothetical protein I7X12_18290 [Halosimplex litoreum]|uniref:Archaeal Type IV pilin N-terminal domain-containing protein n=1 Tax=Halosimplex litoreum TaxID=1198301 RepID=A0A7T3FXT2_9EURY|nr:type IV pilin [Halosimplex litoreum]QPV62651.1 hypothetical protein I7X12_18290 [Halosimplex litoreum]
MTDESSGETDRVYELWNRSVWLIGLITTAIVGAAAIGSVVFGLGVGAGPGAPDASFEIEPTESGIEIVHSDGDAVASDTVHVFVDGDERVVWSDVEGDDGEVTVGDDLSIADVPTGATVRVDWESEGERHTLERTTIERP